MALTSYIRDFFLGLSYIFNALYDCTLSGVGFNFSLLGILIAFTVMDIILSWLLRSSGKIERFGGGVMK